MMLRTPRVVAAFMLSIVPVQDEPACNAAPAILSTPLVPSAIAFSTTSKNCSVVIVFADKSSCTSAAFLPTALA